MNRVLTSGILVACVLAALGAAAQQQPTFRGTAATRSASSSPSPIETAGSSRRSTQEDFEIRDEGKPQPITLFDNTPAADPPDRHARRLGQHGGQPAAAARGGAAAVLAAPAGRRRARRHVRPRRHDQPDVHARSRRAAGRVARRRSRPMHRRRSGARSTRRSTRSSERGDERARRSWCSATARTAARSASASGSSARSRSSIARGSEDVMIYARRHAQPRPRPMHAGHRSGRPAGGAAWPTCRIPASRASPRRPAAATSRFASGRISAPRSRSVADELHSQYLLGFAPPKRDGKVHDVEVRVSQKGMKPRGRKNYVAPKSTS